MGWDKAQQLFSWRAVLKVTPQGKHCATKWINSSIPPSNFCSCSGGNCWSIPGYPSLSFLDTSGDVLALHQRGGDTWTKASPHWTPRSTHGRFGEAILYHFFILGVVDFIIIIFIFPKKSVEGGRGDISVWSCQPNDHCVGLLTGNMVGLVAKVEESKQVTLMR